MAVLGASQPDERGPPVLSGPALRLGRAAWLMLAGLMLAVAAAGVRATYLHGAAPPELSLIGVSSELFRAYRAGLEIVFLLVFFGVAALLFARKSDEGMALFVAATLLVFAAAFVGETELMGVWAWPHEIAGWLARSCMVNLALLFPSGRYMLRWTALLGFGWPAAWLGASLLPAPPTLILFLDLTMLASMAYAQIYRFRHSGAAERQQIKWLAFSYALSFVIAFAVLLAPFTLPTLREGRAYATYTIFYTLVSNLIFLPIPLCIGVAVLRRRLWGIDPIINRTLLYTLLSGCVVAVYVLTVGVLSLLLREAHLLNSLLATSAVAVAVQPLRARLQRRINQVMYGERDAPLAVLARLSQRLEGTLAPETILQAIVETLTQALKLPYAAIVLENGDVAATTGEGGAERLRGYPLVYGSEQLGELRLAPRAPGEAFSPTEQHLLKTVANQASVAVHALRLTADLQKSRERLVRAREEERLRIRRDLHDGLGPVLANLTLGLDITSVLLEQDPAAVKPHLEALKGQTRAAIADIRRLVYALRPPALDELGLAPALRQRAASFQTSGLNVLVDAREPLPPLSPATEVATYRIVEEALTNVVRHAHASSCRVKLTHSGGLLIEVTDNGVGLQDTSRAGIGLGSMRERAEELGGTFQVTRIPAGGTRVAVKLPLERRG